ncbi:MAG: ABC transporter permease, partial [Clostridiales bacterium]|nr:ABC transporter permease [Clostridiales bacterium]
MKAKFKAFLDKVGVPTFAVTLLLIVILIAAYFMGQSIPTLISDIIRRVGMNGLLVLAMVPAIKSGAGPNFALPVGIEGGLMAMVICMQLDLSGWTLILCAVGL